MTETPAPAEQPAGKPTIQFDDFLKLDLRVGTVIEAGPHPNADKLLVLKVDLGGETRQILAGIRAWYEPESLVGRNIIVVANLAPRKMRGLESQGMLLAASTAEDDSREVVVLTTEKPVPPGSSVS
jgi:methionyl-tRNA synthetase